MKKVKKVKEETGGCWWCRRWIIYYPKDVKIEALHNVACERPPRQPKPAPTNQHQFQRAWDSLTLDEKFWVRTMTGVDGPDPSSAKPIVKPTKQVPVANGTPVRASSSESEDGNKRYKIHGHNVTSVIRWMGCNDWDFETCRHAINKLGLTVSDITIKCQLAGSKNKSRGEPARLTKAEEQELKKLVEDRKCQTNTGGSAKGSPTAPTAGKGTREPRQTGPGSTKTSSSRGAEVPSAGRRTTSKSETKKKLKPSGKKLHATGRAKPHRRK